MIARELAIDVGNAAFRPDVVVHTPGVASQIADKLSRKYDPNFVYTLPPGLDQAVPVDPPPRGREWWLTDTAAAHMDLDKGGVMDDMLGSSSSSRPDEASQWQ